MRYQTSSRFSGVLWRQCGFCTSWAFPPRNKSTGAFTCHSHQSQVEGCFLGERALNPTTSGHGPWQQRKPSIKEVEVLVWELAVGLGLHGNGQCHWNWVGHLQHLLQYPYVNCVALILLCTSGFPPVPSLLCLTLHGTHNLDDLCHWLGHIQLRQLSIVHFII